MTLVDTNVLLDLLTDDLDWADWSIAALDATAVKGPVAINDVVYAELSVRFDAIETLEAVLGEADVRLLAIPREALAGKAFARYRAAGGAHGRPARLLHRRPCGGGGCSAAHQGRAAIRGLFPDGRVDYAVRVGRRLAAPTHWAAVTNFVIMPMSFLSGAFYLIERLPELFKTASQYNPFFYMIAGFRYGFIGHTDGSLGVGVAVVAGSSLVMGAICWWLFQTGYRLKS